jgi:hypothetical protein
MGLIGCGPWDLVEFAVDLTLSSIFVYASRPANYLELRALANSDSTRFYA